MSISLLSEVRVTAIGEFIRHHACERRFKLEIGNRLLTRTLPFADRLFNSLDPVLQEAGRKREEDWERMLIADGLVALTVPGATPDDDDQPAWEDFAQAVASLAPGHAAYAREVRVTGEIGGFHVSGRIDFVIVLWRNEMPVLRLVECKASRRDRTYHRVQVALYRHLVQEMLHRSPAYIGGVAVVPEAVECVVARIDEATEQSQDIIMLEPLDLAMEEADIERLLADEGALRRIVETDLVNLPYKLDQTCDGCVFNVHCLPESARQRRLELIGIDPATVRTLRGMGIGTIDDLAELDLTGPVATALRRTSGFTENMERLVALAQARRRTLPGGDLDPDNHEVISIPHMGDGTLPEHEIDGRRLVRIYLAVDYDYVENRVGALSAHVTTSAGMIHTDGTWNEGRFEPDPVVRERLGEIGRDANGRAVYEIGPLRGKDVIHFARTEWTGHYDIDTGMEKQLIQSFLMELVDAIAEVAEADEAPIHFYVWSHSEMTSLIEACSRVSSRLLGSLRELLGCRESLEQLIYSSLQDEVNRRYALGWTGRGLSVVTSLTWFGRRYHWHRRVSGAAVDLDRAFTQDIFDFKTALAIDGNGNWVDEHDPLAVRHRFEIRSRFHDSLTAPYWRAYWRTLPDPARMIGRDRRVASAIERYNHAARPGYLGAYLAARVQALRWSEEGVRFKNSEIVKPVMRIADLPDFSLGVDNAAQASIDFLRLDQHTKVTNWISEHLVPPVYRIPLGRTIPLREVRSYGTSTLSAMICTEMGGFDRTALANVSTISEGSFVRLTPSAADPYRGQTLRQLIWGGRTCVVDSINWETGEVRLSVLYSRGGRYVLFGGGAGEAGVLFDFATLDESVSDFVAGRVDERLQAGRGTHAYNWFDPEEPSIPAQVPPSDIQVAQ